MAKEREPKLKPIGDISATIMRLFLNFTGAQLEKKIGNEDVKDGVMLAFPLAKTIIEVLNDEIPENDKQVREALLDHINGPVADFLDRILGQKIEPIENEDVEALLVFIKDKAISALRLITDDDAQNKAQLDLFFDELMRDPQFHALVIDRILIPIAVKAGATEEWVEFLREVIQTTLDGLLKVKAAQLRAQLKQIQEA
jgi:hypothetical protein